MAWPFRQEALQKLARRCLGTHLSSGMSLVKYNPLALARTGFERMKIRSVPGGNKVVTKTKKFHTEAV